MNRDFSVGKIWTEFVNYADSGNIKIFYELRGYSITKIFEILFSFLKFKDIIGNYIINKLSLSNLKVLVKDSLI